MTTKTSETKTKTCEVTLFTLPLSVKKFVVDRGGHGNGKIYENFQDIRNPIYIA